MAFSGQSADWKSHLPPISGTGRLHLERPLVCFDLETTGLSRETCRVVEFGAVKLFPNGRVRTFRWLMNPGTPIPLMASKKHKIRDQDVINCPMFSAFADSIMQIFQDSDMLGFNSMSFDTPFLKAEFDRLSQATDRPYKFPPPGTHELDAMRIFHSKEKANWNAGNGDAETSTSTGYGAVVSGQYDLEDTADSSQPWRGPDVSVPVQHQVPAKKPKMDLTAALDFYCGEPLKNAHTALADADATLHVFLAQIDMYLDLPADVPGIHDFCQRKQRPSSSQKAMSSTSTQTQTKRPPKAKVQPPQRTSADPDDLASLMGGLSMGDPVNLQHKTPKPLVTRARPARQPITEHSGGSCRREELQSGENWEPQSWEQNTATQTANHHVSTENVYEKAWDRSNIQGSGYAHDRPLPAQGPTAPRTPIQTIIETGYCEAVSPESTTHACQPQQAPQQLSFPWYQEQVDQQYDQHSSEQTQQHPYEPDHRDLSHDYKPRRAKQHVQWQDNEPYLAFGKYRHHALEWVADNDAGYLIWILNEGNFPKDVTQLVGSYVQGYRSYATRNHNQYY